MTRRKENARPYVRRRGPTCAYCFTRRRPLVEFWDRVAKCFDVAHESCLPDTSAQETAVLDLLRPPASVEVPWSM